MRQPIHNLRSNRRLGIESLEARQMLTVAAAIANFDTAGGFATEIEQLPSQGSIVFNAATRNVTVEGSEARDVVTIQLDTRSTAATDDDVIQVSLANTGKSLSAQYRVADVAKVVVSYDDVRQGDVSDCYFLSALGEIAQHSPSTLANMFTDNGDGTFTVRFYRDGASQFVTVNRYLPVNKSSFAIYAGWGGARSDVATNELWVALAEKAYAQLNESGWIGQNGYNSYLGLDLGQSANAFKHIANKSATVVKSLSNSAILTALGAGKAITLATKDSGTASNIVPNHEYMLIGYDPATKKFNVYQPAGSAFKPASLSLSWSEITASFQGWTSVVL